METILYPFSYLYSYFTTTFPSRDDLSNIENTLRTQILTEEVVTEYFNTLFSPDVNTTGYDLSNMYDVAFQVRSLHAYFTAKKSPTSDTKPEKAHKTDPSSPLFVKGKINGKVQILFLEKREHDGSYFGIDQEGGERRELVHYHLHCRFPDSAFIPPTFRLEGGITLQCFVPNGHHFMPYIAQHPSFWDQKNVRDMGISRFLRVHLDESTGNYLLQPQSPVSHLLVSIDGAAILPTHLKVGPSANSPLLLHPGTSAILDQPFEKEEIDRITSFSIKDFCQFLTTHQIEEEAQKIALCAMLVLKRAVSMPETKRPTLRDLLVILYVSDPNGDMIDTLDKKAIDQLVAEKESKASPAEKSTIRETVIQSQLRIMPKKETLFRSIYHHSSTEKEHHSSIDNAIKTVLDLRASDTIPDTQPNKAIWDYYRFMKQP